MTKPKTNIWRECQISYERVSVDGTPSMAIEDCLIHVSTTQSNRIRFLGLGRYSMSKASVKIVGKDKPITDVLFSRSPKSRRWFKVDIIMLPPAGECYKKRNRDRHCYYIVQERSPAKAVHRIIAYMDAITDRYLIGSLWDIPVDKVIK